MIDKIFEKMKWNNNDSLQLEGRKEAQQISDLSLLIQPDYGKEVWNNCALVLEEKTDSQLKIYLKELFEWLQDLNWPGAQTILERLKIFNPKEIIEEYERAILSAYQKNDMSWLYWLSHLLENEKLKLIVSEECLMILNNNRVNYLEIT